MNNHKFISLGLGVQSTAMYYMSSMGELPRCDYAIFVDTGREKKGTMAYLKYLQAWQSKNAGIPIIVVQKKNLFQDLLKSENSTGQRFSSIPAFTKNEDGTSGILRRQCTNEYKIEQVDRSIREVLEVPKVLNQKIEIWKGISLDEIDRMSIPDALWKIHVYAFCGYAVERRDHYKYKNARLYSRADIYQWYKYNHLPIPPKSSCIFCPYQSDASWYDMKVNEPEDFADAVRVDKAIRNSTQKGIKSPIFLHNSCIPLDEIEFRPGLPDLWHGECSGVCHT